MVHRCIRYVPRTPEQQAAHIERRGALLRDTMHREAAQCEHAGSTVDLKHVLGECVRVDDNAILSIKGASPYNAV